MSENREFERRLAWHTAPTLLGIKCGSLISLSSEEFDIDARTEFFNRRAAARGLEMKILCRCGKRSLLLIYSRSLIEKRLADPEVKAMLSDCGYPDVSDVDSCLERLSERVRESADFPHEIGVFLDYPIEDIVGFIENKGENFKLCGVWKVYGNAESAGRKFANYGKCRNYLCNKLNEGLDIYQALRIS